MNPLKRFEEWYERRQPTIRNILVALPVISFIVSFGLTLLPILVGDIYLYELRSLPFVITGSVVLFIILSIHKGLGKDMFSALVFGLFLPFIYWGLNVSFLIAMGIYLHWQISLLFLTSVGAVFILWKLWRRRKRE